MLSVTLYKDRKECEAAHQGSEFFTYCGPIHKHGDDLFIQLYMGQHEWVAVNAYNPKDVRIDPGYEGTEYGWGHVARGTQILPDGREAPVWISNVCDYTRTLPEPESVAASITADEILFSGKECVEEHLGMTLDAYEQAKAEADKNAQDN